MLAIGDAERRLTRRLALVLAHHDCTVERWRALSLLAHGSSHRMSELAEFTQLPPASLTRLVDGLVADNLVHRKPDPRDRRGVLVHITERGLALAAALSERIVAERHARRRRRAGGRRAAGRALLPAGRVALTPPI